MKTKQMSYGITWLFLTLLMVGMSWSAAVSPMDESVLSSSDGDSTPSTEVDIVAFDATEMNTNDLIFEEEASEDIEIKVTEEFGFDMKPDVSEEEAAMYAEIAEQDALDAEIDALYGDSVIYEELPEGVDLTTVPEAPTSESYETTSGRATCSGTTVLGAMMFEDFEGGSSYTSSLASTDFEGKTGNVWRRNYRRGNNWGTGSSGTGPSSDHSPQGTRFAYTEGSGTGGAWEEIQHKDCLDSSSLGTMNFEYWYHMYGDSSGWQYTCSGWSCGWSYVVGMRYLNFDISTDGGQNWVNLYSKYGPQGNSWKTTGINNIDSYAGESNLAIRWNAQMSSPSFRDDYAIDDVKIFGTLLAGDADGDGVIDTNDLCDGNPVGEPTHPPNVDVGSDGCPLDTDGDSVWDIVDQCPYTPASLHATTDTVGCPAGLAIPWEDNFESRGNIITSNVDGWFSYDSTDNNNDWLWYASNTYCGNDPAGNHCAASMYDYDTGKKWLVSPRINVPTDYSFGIDVIWDEYTQWDQWYRGSYGRSTNMQSLYVSDKACDPSMNDFTEVWTATQNCSKMNTYNEKFYQKFYFLF